MKTYIMGVETSCDETAVAVVEDGKRILSNLVSSQVDLHKRYGGVVPEIASRRHLEKINPLIDEAMETAGLKPQQLSALAVSYGPGLVGALLVGVSTAKALAYVWNIPLIPVNHLRGHLYANYLTGEKIVHPCVGLVASGGHTDLLYSPREGEIHLLGSTRDDAAGEAFDKVARTLKLGYPGGPAIDALAAEGDAEAISFPRASLSGESHFDFSFSGIKTAVLNYLNRLKQKGEEPHLPNLAASFQQAVVDMLVEKTVEAVKYKMPSTFLLSGGVAANSLLRRQLKEKLEREVPGINFLCPPPWLCTDNAAMLAAAAYPQYVGGEEASLTLNAMPDLTL